MKNKKCIILNLWIFFLISPFMVMAQMPQIETLDRGIVAVNMSKKEGQKKNGIFLSWRFLDSDDKTTLSMCTATENYLPKHLLQP